MKFTAPVIKGKGRGKDIVGFPTFNIAIPRELQVEHGIYACRVWIGQTEYRGALHYGPVPTFQDTEISLEIFILDYQDAAPVTELTFELGPYLRPITPFTTAQALHAQIALDVEQVRTAVFSN